MYRRIGGNLQLVSKPTDTGTILNYRSCAPNQYKRSVIQGTVHRVFRSKSNREQFDKAIETNRQWLKNQYPENWSVKVAADAVDKVCEGKGKPLDSERISSTQTPEDVKPPMLMVQYRGNQSQYFASRLQNLTNVQAVFTTRKLESNLPSLKSYFLMTTSQEWFLNYHVVDAFPPMSNTLFDI